VPKHATLPSSSAGKILQDDGAWIDASAGGGDPPGTALGLINAHLSATDPHDQYLTAAEGDSAYSAGGHNHDAAYAAVGHAHTGVYQPAATVLTNTTASFTTAQETKLSGIATGATSNATDAQLRDRSTHTGSQTASTISDFTEASQDVIGAMVTAAGGSYNDTANTITLPAGGASPVLYNQSTAAQGAGFATDTYLTGSSIATAGRLKIGSRYRLRFDVSKTAAGTATPVIIVRFGTNGTTADTARLTFTFLAGTAAADIGTFDIFVTFRVVGASAVMQGQAQCNHRLSTTGLQNQPGTTLQVTSAAFDSSAANAIIGVSVNGGTSAAWTVQLVQAELGNLA
jgi:hypothetical protein